jgi:hypothetical protein
VPAAVRAAQVGPALNAGSPSRPLLHWLPGNAKQQATELSTSRLLRFGGADENVRIFRCLQEEYERRRGAFEKGEEEVTRMVEQRAAQEERLGNLVMMPRPTSICFPPFPVSRSSPPPALVNLHSASLSDGPKTRPRFLGCCNLNERTDCAHLSIAFFLVLTCTVWLCIARGMHDVQVVQNERVQSELEAMRRKESSDREGARELEGRMQRTANELHECLADKMTLEGEKRALEESLRNVLHINDQLLQKVTAPYFPRYFPPPIGISFRPLNQSLPCLNDPEP